MKTTNKKFIHAFIPTFQELSNIASNPKTGKLKYAIKRNLPIIEETLSKYEKSRQTIFEDRAKHDENGNPMFDANKEYLFQSKELRKEAFEKIAELDNTEIEIDIFQISMSDLTDAIGEISIGREINLEGFIEEEN